MNKPENIIGRRTLLKAAVGGLTLLSAGAVEAESCREGETARWDRDYDVIVLGSGTGLLGALVAAQAGMRVVVLEKADMPGGSTIVSGGVFWIPNNNIMKREGYSDSREGALAYLEKLSLGQAESALITAFVDNGPAMADFLEANTTLNLRVSRLVGAVADYHPEWKGSNRRGRSLEPVQPGVSFAGGLLVSALLQANAAAGVDLLYSCPATRLLTGDSGTGRPEVTGVLAEFNGEPLRIRARVGVLVATGGFERNSVMKAHFLRGPSPYTFGSETNTGDGIHMGMALGADLRNMNEVWGQTVYRADADQNGALRGGISLWAQIDQGNGGCITVNRYGERFCNEAADYDSTWRSFHTWQNWSDLGYRNLPAYHVFDQAYRDRYPLAGANPGQQLPAWVAVADTPAKLADKLGIDRAGLQAQLDRFNHYARQGRDPDFHRGESAYDTHGLTDLGTTLAPLETGPFYGAEVSPADLGTCGGLRVNGRAQVVDVFGEPIKGLYASGNTTGVGSPGALYGGGGGTIGPALTFAFIAGKQLSTLS